ncbi:AAA family ATPase [Haloarcula sp. S1CR25-12]|uniref:AAA family ATPase n=1 Tax=Haloarcula saliterrae TaxID=2950534 RepID=A0ABU2F8X6_9EURY|nr:AAA family ATPase [Haloarcula sp. S1CR25-12]MDS0258717.1 AAA family ATPase [Haloarcula sp. S1CR25-12]
MSEEEIKSKVQEAIQEDQDIDEKYEAEFLEILENRYSRLTFDESSVSLSRMHIEGYRAIQKLDISFTDPNTVVHGKNSKGKSSFIEATRFNLFGRKDDDPLVTDPIREDFERLGTNGYWSKDDTDYRVYRGMEGGPGVGYSGQNEPNIIENPDENKTSKVQRHTQGDIREFIGYTPIYQQDFDDFDVFSLFSVITGELRKFYSCDDATDLIDVLFGITLTNVERGVENQIEECRLSEEEQEAKAHLRGREQRAVSISKDIRSLIDEQEEIESEIVEKIEEKEELSRLLENKEDISETLTEKIDIQDEISDLQNRKQEKDDEFGSIKQEISKLESDAVTEEIAPALEEMKQMVALPNRCPVCTNDIDPSEHRQFHEEGDCPLCGKDVDDDRYESVSEVDEEGEILEQEKRQEELNELEEKKRRVRGEIEFLAERIEEKKEQLEELEEEQSESKFREYKQRKSTLEEKIGSLKEQSRKLELRIETKREMLHDLALEVRRLTRLNEQRVHKEERRAALKSFQDLLVEERIEARRELQTRLKRRMESLLDVFSRGTFKEADYVTFRDRDSYRYTVHVANDKSKPELLEQTNAELTLSMLLFHTSVLAELQREETMLPLKLLMIDSPYGNGQDGENAEDITDFLLEIPEVLDEYQIIISMADSSVADQVRLEQKYDIESIDDYLDDEVSGRQMTLGDIDDETEQ